ncbi:aldo/keto reductase [Octadecabacter sp. 1_MG-2023]|uniref:aldo/keto reductase n=1 Tax=unclassified Octadecabacter TaxID=196158 RepID=UPI001C08A791|nr:MULTISPECIES: aldo/keto reductase [unclassified Octadecabacter]MBU2993074.1 aldo/keto reductase [Octadecabacter sp. B2R22]MDO6733474.1 aldo/keto reductase [Octadecabacter sp. 1_MG-2023]
MERVNLTKDLSLSRMVYGMWRLGDVDDTSPKTVQAKIEACLQQGITTMDQADIYGGYMAEEIMGAGLTQSIKDQIEVVTKCDILIPAGRYENAPGKYYDTSREHILASVDHSLRLMGLDKIDVLLIHRPDPLMDHHETGAALDEVVASGKVRAVGVSNFKLHDWTLLQSAMKTQLVTNQIEVSLSAHDALTNGDLAFLQERSIAPMAWSPLGGGALMTENNALGRVMDDVAGENGVDRAAVAVAWLLAHPSKIMPVMGTNNLSRIRGFSDAFKVDMSRTTWFKLYEAALGHEVA